MSDNRLTVFLKNILTDLSRPLLFRSITKEDLKTERNTYKIVDAWAAWIDICYKLGALKYYRLKDGCLVPEKKKIPLYLEISAFILNSNKVDFNFNSYSDKSTDPKIAETDKFLSSVREIVIDVSNDPLPSIYALSTVYELIKSKKEKEIEELERETKDILSLD